MRQRTACRSFLIAALIASGAAQSVFAADPPKPSTWCRFVPERKDDFAWENDLVAFRAYGPALKGSAEHENSGIDCWLKRVKYPIVDKWYAGEKKGISYHKDHGEGFDPYHTGSSRGCGGISVWRDGKLVNAGVFHTWKIISRTPEKSEFELTYEYELPDGKVNEVKRITIGLGKRMFRAESTFTRGGKPVEIEVAIGVTTHDGKGKATLRPDARWMSCWENIEGSGLGAGVVLPPSVKAEFKDLKSDVPDESHALAIAKTDVNGKIVWYAGYGWEKAGEIKTPEDWANYLDTFSKSLR